MSTDTRWIVGTGAVLAGLIVTVGLGLAGLIVSQHAALHARMDRIDARMDRIEDRLEGFDERLRAVEFAFGQVDQRLATLERLHLPTPPAD